MKDEELKKLAEECSLYYQGRPSNKGYELSNRLTIESYALMTLKWLSERFYIIPKSKVKDEYEVAKSMIYSNKIIDQDCGIVRKSLMDYLFGKDTFEEEGK